MSNPYLATLNITTTNSGFDNQIQVWNANGPYAGSYQPSNIIAPFQAFIVHKTSVGAGGSYTINASDRVVTPQTFYALAANQLTIIAENTTTNLLDKTTVGFDVAATDTFDSQLDINKMPGALNRQTIYSVNNNKWLAKNILNSITTTPNIPVGFEAGATGTYTLTFNGVNTFDPTTYIMLEDTKLNTLTDVRNGNYSFTADSADDRNRFILHFTPAAIFNTVASTCNSAGSINIQQPGTANWAYTLTDSVNAIVASGTLNQSQPLTMQVPTGIYSLTLIDANNYTVVKSIVVGGAETVTADFQVNTTGAQVNQPVSLTAATSGAATYQWSFGNGTAGTGESTSATYTQPGVYVVSLVVTSPTGCTSSATKNVTVTTNTTGINSTSIDPLTIYSHDNMLYVNLTGAQNTESYVAIYDILGQQISNERVNGNVLYQKEIDNVDAAYFIVMVKNSDKTITRKVFITNNK
jgi:PKD domain